MFGEETFLMVGEEPCEIADSEMDDRVIALRITLEEMHKEIQKIWKRRVFDDWIRDRDGDSVTIQRLEVEVEDDDLALCNYAGTSKILSPCLYAGTSKISSPCHYSDFAKNELALSTQFHSSEIVNEATEQSEMIFNMISRVWKVCKECQIVLYSVNSMKRQQWIMMLYPHAPVQFSTEKCGISVKTEEKESKNQLKIRSTNAVFVSTLLYSRGIEVKKADLLTPSSTIRLNSIKESNKASVKISIIPCVTDFITDRVSTKAVVYVQLQNATLEEFQKMDSSTRLAISTTMATLHEGEQRKSTATSTYSLNAKGQLKVMIDMISQEDLLLVKSGAININFVIHLIQDKY